LLHQLEVQPASGTPFDNNTRCTMYVLGLTGFADTGSHDAAAALVCDGIVISAAEEERFTRKKHSWGLSPSESASYCLKQAGLQIRDLDAIAYGWNIKNEACSIRPRGGRGNWVDTMLPFSNFPETEIPPVYFIKHHLSHISGAFYLSGFQEAACMCIDGQGERESITLASARLGEIKILRSYDITCSLGAMYEAATFYCGFGYHAPGKLMGLASYGEARHELPIDFDAETGEFSIDLPNIPPSKSDFIVVREAYVNFFETHCYPFRRGIEDQSMSYIHVAASVQKVIEQVVHKLAIYLKKISRMENLVISGGVALNCTCNGYLERSGAFADVFVPPGPNDASCSIGSAMEVFRLKGKFDTSIPQRLLDARLGPSFADTEIAAAFSHYRLQPTKYDELSLCKAVARALAQGKIVLWFQGRAEFGPRALGSRSILASPCERSIHSAVNTLKGRELWRPLSPSILQERYSDYFSDRVTSPASVMLKAVPTNPERASKIPAVVHIDGSARPHAVNANVNPRYHRLLGEFEKLTTVPVILNTSLNLRGEPIVSTPDEALSLFTRTSQAAVVAIGDYVYQR
jgi:carbamoyltransferase